MTAVAQARLPRGGLGNRLFPWARCAVFCRNTGVGMISPRWSQLAIGPLLRRERDPRHYLSEFGRVPEELRGFSSWLMRRLSPDLGEPPLSLSSFEVASSGVYRFSGLADYFGRLDGDGAWLRSELVRRLAPGRREALRPFEAGGFLACHVRRGDFRPPTSAECRIRRGAEATPIGWFVRSVERARHRLGCPLRVVVASDGNDEELGPLLGLPDTERLDTGTASTDLLSLSGAAAILGSADSTFSGWASLLGDVPIATCPGRPFTALGLRSRAGRFVGELDPFAGEGEWDTFLARFAPSEAGPAGWFPHEQARRMALDALEPEGTTRGSADRGDGPR